MPHGVHSTTQTAFRIPEGLLASAKDAARQEGITLTAWVISAIAEKLRKPGAGATPAAAPAEPVSPPQRARTPRPTPESASEIAAYLRRRNGRTP